MHGGADRAVNPSHSLRLAQGLQELGAVYPLVIYAEDDHALTRHRVERDTQAAAWFQRNGEPAYNR
jgi:dipeptidyl aminopeptidase/acylaminoacyl peptidase